MALILCFVVVALEGMLVILGFCTCIEKKWKGKKGWKIQKAVSSTVSKTKVITSGSALGAARTVLGLEFGFLLQCP